MNTRHLVATIMIWSVVSMGQAAGDADFNGDGLLNANDADLMTDVISAGTNDVSFDLNGDGVVDLSDLDIWFWLYSVASGVTPDVALVDVNFDTLNNLTDYMILLNNRGMSSSRWTDGDLNATGTVDNADLTLYMVRGGVGPGLVTQGVVAYWRFEEGADQSNIQHNGAPGIYSPDVPDVSGNGHDLAVWASDQWQYRANVAYDFVPYTGANNILSIKNVTDGPTLWNTTLAAWEPAQWTIEATFKAEAGGWKTIVGRDSYGSARQGNWIDVNLSGLYFQTTANPEMGLAIKYVDRDGYVHAAESAPDAYVGFDWSTDPDGLTAPWYSMAATSDGRYLRLYLYEHENPAAGYQLIAETDMTVVNPGSTDTALDAGAGSGTYWQAGDISVGRGMYAGDHTDRFYGYLDEVRISDRALAPSEFLQTASIADPDLVGWWRCNAGLGNTLADSSGLGNNGNFVNHPQWVAGYDGSGLHFDGSSSYVDCGNPAAFDLNEQVTLALWIKTEDAANGQHNPYVGKGDTSYAIKHHTSNSIEFFIYDDTWYTARAPVDSSFNGVWHHVAGTYDGASLKVYLDGALQATTAHVGTIASSTYTVNIARNSQMTDRFYAGAVDDVRIYSRALTSREINFLAASRSPTIVLVSDCSAPETYTGTPPHDVPERDNTLILFLQDLGYTVDTSGMNKSYQENQDPFANSAKVAALDAADLILVSRHTTSGDYD
ncbi:MAG TPA: hypothetical protein ENO19_08080, partial [Halothiobacillaceae bacterium]|nr:hypothetical protein [Halothiobacillaceae bacterium]